MTFKIFIIKTNKFIRLVCPCKNNRITVLWIFAWGFGKWWQVSDYIVWFERKRNLCNSLENFPFALQWWRCERRKRYFWTRWWWCLWITLVDLHSCFCIRHSLLLKQFGSSFVQKGAMMKSRNHTQMLMMWF